MGDVHVVFGSTGPVGAAVVDELVRRGLPARAVSRSGTGTWPGDAVQIVQTDVMHAPDAHRATGNAAVVYHCIGAPYQSWPTHLPPAMDRIIAATEAASAKLVYADNLHAYGAVTRPLTEDLPAEATGPNGLLRATLSDAVLAAHGRGKLRATIGRASDLYGPRVRRSHAGERVFGAALKGAVANILADPTQPHTYTYIRDFARALVTLGCEDEADGNVWHVPNTPTRTTGAFIADVFRAAGTEPAMRVAPAWVVQTLAAINPTMRALNETLYQVRQPWIVDDSRFRSAFGDGVTPEPDALAETVAWYRETTRPADA